MGVVICEGNRKEVCAWLDAYFRIVFPSILMGRKLLNKHWDINSDSGVEIHLCGRIGLLSF
jgi:hypothetical protein